jgi:serine O-acetyltransferase
MSLRKVLVSDLQRQYEFDQTPGRMPSMSGVIRRMLNPRFTPVVLCRITHKLYQRGLEPLARLVSIINFVLFGIEIAMRCEIGEGLYFPHTGGTVIGARRIGKNAVIYHGVTLGAKEVDIGYHDDQRPIVGDNVIVGSGAKILGGITIGNHVIVGANAVVVDSVPDNVVVGGIPARILRHIGED